MEEILRTIAWGLIYGSAILFIMATGGLAVMGFLALYWRAGDMKKRGKL